MPEGASIAASQKRGQARAKARLEAGRALLNASVRINVRACPCLLCKEAMAIKAHLQMIEQEIRA